MTWTIAAFSTFCLPACSRNGHVDERGHPHCDGLVAVDGLSNVGLQ